MSSDIDVQTAKCDQRIILYDVHMIAKPDASQVESWVSPARSGSRGNARLLEWQEQILIIKHYFRGGVPAFFNRDCYFGVKPENARSWREFYLLRDMQRMGLPVPHPVAAIFSRSGLVYRADLITVYIEHSASLAELMFGEMPDGLWQAIGSCIRRFHDHGVNHADLNATNILVRDSEAYIIDFDKSRIMKDNTTNANWKQGNLLRLQRSLHKINSNNTARVFQDRKWELLIEAYNTPNS